MSHRHRPATGERGIALVMALLVLLVISIVGALLMASLQSETRMSSHDLRQAKALNIAEAGVNEAIAKIRDDAFPERDPVTAQINPRQVAQVFLTMPGSVPVLGADSIGLATSQPAGQWLPYSTAGRDTNVLEIEWKTKPARDSVYRYDTTRDPPINLVSGWPIYRITSTSIRGGDYRRVTTEVIRKPVNVNIKGALAANRDIFFAGNAVVCGYNHKADTPYPAGAAGRGNTAPGVPDCQPYENLAWGPNMPSCWSSGNVDPNGFSTQYGENVPSYLQGQTGFYTGPWESVGMSQAEYWSWVGPPTPTAPATPNGILHLDNDNSRMNQSGSFAFHNVEGEGLLYVDGDLTLNAGFVYTGLVYIEGNLTLNGSAWILGALVVRGRVAGNVSMTGGATVLYSNEAIQRVLAKYGGQFVTLSWKESNR